MQACAPRLPGDDAFIGIGRPQYGRFSGGEFSNESFF
jgi:hypothetical protein